MSDKILRLKARYIERPVLAAVPSQPLLRKIFELTARLMDRPPPDVSVARRGIVGVPGLYIRPIDAEETPRLLYFHGGGFTIGSARTHLGLVARLAEAAGVAAFVPDYNLAPEHPFPAAHDDALKIYDALSRQAPMAVAGDSAGGTLAAWLTIERSPVAAALISPLLDCARMMGDTPPDFTGELLIPPAWPRRLIADLGHPDLTDPRLTPLPHLEARVPMAVHVGSGEVLRADAEALAAQAGAALSVFEGVPHVWQLHGAWNETARRSLAELGAFLRRHL